jgi:hypothetical protein
MNILNNRISINNVIESKKIMINQKNLIVTISFILSLHKPCLPQLATIIPDPPIEKVPVIAGIDYSKGDQLYYYKWLVNSVIIDEGLSPQTFKIDFESGFTPCDGDTIMDSSGVDLKPDRFGTAAHFGNGNIHLSFPAEENISSDSGSVSLWFSLDYDFDNPVYRNYNHLFCYRIDDKNALYIESDESEPRFRGTSQSDGAYYGTWYEIQHSLFKANEWHHIVWTWDTKTHKQWLYIDGLNVNTGQEFIPPSGSTNEFIIGTSQWGSSTNAFASIDEFRLYSRALNENEVMALYLYPDKDIDAVLPASNFKLNDNILFTYRIYNGQTWTEDTQTGLLTVMPVPISKTMPRSDVLPVGTATGYFSIETNMHCLCKCDTHDVQYEVMNFTMQSNDFLNHSFSFMAKKDHPYSWNIRCAPLNDTKNPYPVKRQYNTRVIKDYDPDYPKIFSLWADWGDDYIHLAKHDLAIVSHAKKDVVVKARKINSHLKVLTTYNMSYGGSADTLFQAASNNPDDPLYNCVFCDPVGNILYEELYGHTMYNLTNPVCVDYLVQLTLGQWENDCLLYDGFYFDRVQSTVSYMWNEIDIDRDGIADSDNKITSAWRAGVKDFLSKIREHIPNAIICCNDAIYDYSEWIHGRLFECKLSSVMDGYDDFNQIMKEYTGWNDVHRDPWALPLITMEAPLRFFNFGVEPWNDCPVDSVTWAREQYNRMRFGLCSALIGDGLYTYDFFTTWWGHKWWYDEYDAALGKPLGPAYALPDTQTSNYIWIEDFESGEMKGFQQPPWNSHIAFTEEPDKVINGQYSLMAYNNNPNETWNEYIWSDTNEIKLQPNTQYTFSFRYKIIEEAVEGDFYAIVRKIPSNEDIWFHSWDPPAGVIDSVNSVITTDSHKDYYFLFGIKKTGTIVLDDIKISTAGYPPWRRNFTSGIVIVNSSMDSVDIELEKPFRAIAGTQDPEINHGGIVRTLTLQPYDGRILLRSNSTIVEDPLTLKPKDDLNFFLYKNFPDPFNSETNIKWYIPKQCKVNIRIFDILGRNVRTLVDSYYETGLHTVSWNGKDKMGTEVTTGIYLYRMESNDFIQTGKALLLK